MSNSELAKYVILAQELKNKVDSGEWQENTVLPTEREIAELSSFSRSTVRKAILLMTEEGYLRSEHGIGTFVMPESVRDSFHSLHSLSDDIESKGQIAGQEILELTSMTPTPYLRDKLSLETEDTLLQKIKRIRFSGTTPIGIHTAYVPLMKGSTELTREELDESKSLYKVMEHKWSIKPSEAIESINARLPSAQESQLLEIPMNEPLLTCSRTTFSSKYTPIEYVEMVYPVSRYDYKIRINRKSFQS